ncbi:C1 family peptidase [Arcanobacterium haemolyticum]|nr:C1 family peptidase [Arcanobacterium haemolyticum]
MSTPVNPEWVNERNAAFQADRTARVVGNAVATTDVEKLSLDRTVLTSIDSSVSDLIPDAEITDQKHSGRCWAFAGLNVLRAAIIKELKLETFEFSQSFVYFYDKIEKANTFLNHVVEDAEAGADLMDRNVTASFEEPIGDGGYWPEFARLVAKYGAVPRYAMPDAFSATSSSAMNDSLATILRRGGLRLRAAVAAGEPTEPIRAAVMADVHRVLSIHLGTPPERFMWQYRDKDKEFHRVGELTPLEFAAKYAANVKDFVVLAHDPRPETQLHQRYGIDRTDVMIGEATQEHVTATIDELKAACVRAIQAGTPVWFACDVAKQRDKETGTWDAALHDYEGLYGVDLTMTKAERLVARESMLTHAMCFTGVDLVDGKPRRWRVENSWGEDYGEKGFWTMNDSWFDEYVYETVVPTDGLPEEITAALTGEVIILPHWDPML